jgi:hypothetical protein
MREIIADSDERGVWRAALTVLSGKGRRLTKSETTSSALRWQVPWFVCCCSEKNAFQLGSTDDELHPSPLIPPSYCIVHFPSYLCRCPRQQPRPFASIPPRQSPIIPRKPPCPSPRTRTRIPHLRPPNT